MLNDIVTFGKYKNQPIEILKQDKPYLEWLSTQDWFREKYKNIYQTVIINNFNEPNETPEHNKLQTLFLNKSFLAQFLIIVKNKKYLEGVSPKDLEVEFEYKGIDILLRYKNSDNLGLGIEIKPSISDDYPAVLRQIKTSRDLINYPCILFLDSYTGQGATLEEFIQIFKSSYIDIIFKHEVERIKLLE